MGGSGEEVGSPVRPAGASLDISSITSGIRFDLNTHTQGFDYPVAYTDGTHGCTNFTDTLVYNYSDHTCVPNPPSGFFPSVGCCGANDGHLVVVDTSTGEYYDFWKLSADASGVPASTNVGQIVSGGLSGNGTPGATAAGITGLAGDILPGELDCATCLNHALSVIVLGSMNSNQVGTQAPAVKTDGTVSGAIFREGAKSFIRSGRVRAKRRVWVRAEGARQQQCPSAASFQVICPAARSWSWLQRACGREW